jgi:hypothetical protein
VNDTSNNIQTAIIEITCVDTEVPNWIEIPQNQVINYGVEFVYDVNASDNVAVTVYWLNNTAHFEIDSQGVITNMTVLDSGTYSLTIRAFDSSGNYISAEILITVEPKSTPNRRIPGFRIDIAVGSILLTILLLYVKNRRKLKSFY